MKFSRLRRADEYEFALWMKEQEIITNQQYCEIVNREYLRFSGFKFYKKKELKKHNFLWRLTAPFYLVYCVLLIMAMPLKWMITGNRYLPQKFLDNFHHKWEENMGW